MRTYFLVFSNPIPGKEAEYNDWYTNIHLGEVCAIKGFKGAQRFVLTKAQQSEDQTHRYLAIYEMENDDVGGTIKRLNDAVTTLRLDPVIDIETVKVSVFQSITDVVGATTA